MTQFRPAAFDDIPFITNLLAEFYAKQGTASYGIPFDAQSTLLTVERVVRHGICLVGPTSCAGAMLMPFPYNHNVVTAHVMFWYFKRAREIKIFETLIACCLKARATHVSASSHSPRHIIGRLYEKWELRPVEGLHMGPLINVALQPQQG